MGPVPLAAANDGLFPSAFSKLSGQGVPATGILISAGLATALVAILALGSGEFSRVYSIIVGLSTMAAVTPYAFCALASGLVAHRLKPGTVFPRVTAIEIIAFVFAIFTLYGCGAEAVLYGMVLLMLGIPVFVWQSRHSRDRSGEAGQ
jgi:arginine:agmatine antiporter